MTGATARKLELFGRVNNLRPGWLSEFPRFPAIQTTQTNIYRNQQSAISFRV